VTFTLDSPCEICGRGFDPGEPVFFNHTTGGFVHRGCPDTKPAVRERVRPRLDPRLSTWAKKHKPLCPVCRKLPMPQVECARVWAPDWAAECWPVDELVDQADEEAKAALLCAQAQVKALQLELDDLRRLASERMASEQELFEEVELLRRDNASLRAGAEQDFEAANNWRRYVAMVGEKRASLYLIPPRKEDSN
jgi:hypothetical protein